MKRDSKAHFQVRTTSMNVVDALPDLCIDQISCSLQDLYKNDVRASAKMAASLCQVSKSSLFTQRFANDLFDLLDPGCVEELDDLRAREATDDIVIGKLCDVELNKEDAVSQRLGLKRKALLRLREIAQPLLSQLSAHYICTVRHNVRMWVQASADMVVDLKTISTTYKLTKKDLHGISHQRRKNPFFPRAPSSRVYIMNDVMHCFVRKHGPGSPVRQTRLERALDVLRHEQRSVTIVRRQQGRLRHVEAYIAKSGGEDNVAMEAVTAEINAFIHGNLTYKQIDAAIDHARAVHVRKVELTKRLSEVGCKLRSDSRLCDQYIADGVGDISFIVETMQEMKFFYGQTDYARLVETILDALVERERDVAKALGYWLTSEDYRELRDQASAEAKPIALRMWARTLRRPADALADTNLPCSLLKVVKTVI